MKSRKKCNVASKCLLQVQPEDQIASNLVRASQIIRSLFSQDITSKYYFRPQNSAYNSINLKIRQKAGLLTVALSGKNQMTEY